jgi:hypothetical protein
MIVLTLFNGFGAIVYLALWLIVPNEGSPTEGRSTLQEAIAEMQTMVEQLLDRVRAVFSR